mgnify:CR=1 FL=1
MEMFELRVHMAEVEENCLNLEKLGKMKEVVERTFSERRVIEES